eukprot:gene41898-55595_t
MAAYARRTGRDPTNYFTVGDAATIVSRIAEYVAVGVEKFILRPVGPDGETVIAQTRRLIDEVLPQGDVMKIGAAMFFTDYSMMPGELARALEERGFDSVWAPEHSHIPLSRKTPFPGGGDLPKKYYDAMDPFVTLTAAAAATKTLKVGTGVCLVNQRDPIQTAKAVASLDLLSGGRFLFGIGNGWNQDEMENHGTVFTTRHKLVRERIEAMKALWTKSKA